MLVNVDFFDDMIVRFVFVVLARFEFWANPVVLMWNEGHCCFGLIIVLIGKE